MNIIRTIVFVCVVTISFVGSALANETVAESNATTAQDSADKNKLRWFLGGKIGYSGVFVNSIENKTIGKSANKYSTFFLLCLSVSLQGFNMKYFLL